MTRGENNRITCKRATSSIKKGTGRKKDSNKGTDFNGSFLQSPEATGTVSSIEYTTPAINNN